MCERVCVVMMCVMGCDVWELYFGCTCGCVWLRRWAITLAGTLDPLRVLTGLSVVDMSNNALVGMRSFQQSHDEHAYGCMYACGCSCVCVR
jgi:hypothetical protein